MKNPSVFVPSYSVARDNDKSYRKTFSFVWYDYTNGFPKIIYFYEDIANDWEYFSKYF